ncbi:MAG: sigma-70 family RNA polymerase sigma factor [Parcubacteria group bacterium]
MPFIQVSQSRITSSELKTLVEKAQNRDKQAFSAIFDVYYGKLMAYAFRRTLHTEAAQDIVANTFEVVLKKLPAFEWRHAGSFNGWIYRICTNEISHYFRDIRHYTSLTPAVNDEGVEAELEVSDEGQAKLAIETRLLSDQQFAVLSRAMQQLKPIYQELLHLRYFEDLSLREIAEVTGKREVTVRVYMYRALIDLRETLRGDAALLLDVNPDSL